MRLPTIPGGTRTLQRQKHMQKGTDIRRLQQTLKGLGLMEGRVDGVFGEDTAESVANFHRAFSIKRKTSFDEDSAQLLRPILDEGINSWQTLQRDFAHTGSTAQPIGLDLRTKWRRDCTNTIGINCRRNKIVVTSHRGLKAFTIEGRELWKNTEILPLGPSALWNDKILVPTGELAVIGLFKGKTEGSMSQGEFTSSPAISGKTFYAGAGGGIYALDEKGKTLWYYKTSGVLVTAPALAYELIYFSSYDRNLYCLDNAGIPYWKIKTQDIIKNPVACWDSILFAVSVDSWFYALNPLTGKVVWKKQFSAEEFLMPSFRRGLMAAADLKGGIYFLNPQDGNIKGMIQLKSRPTTPPLLCRDTLFIGTEDGLFGLIPMEEEIRHYLSGEKILALMPARLGLAVATENKLVMLEQIF